MAGGKNNGTTLEALASMIETIHIPPDFKVDSRKRTYDTSGKQTAELDVLLTGRMGTIPFSMLIECRDRPSEGKADAAWIEQLVGRRNRFKINAVVAVSSTGFTGPAIEYAAAENIQLRTMELVKKEELDSWLAPTSQIIVNHSEVIRTIINFGKVLSPTGGGIFHLPRMPLDGPFFRNLRTEKLHSAAELWDIVIDENGPLHDEIVPNGDRAKHTLALQDDKLSQFVFELDPLTMSIASLRFEAELWVERREWPMIAFGKYSGEGIEPIRIAHWSGEAIEGWQEMFQVK